MERIEPCAVPFVRKIRNGRFYPPGDVLEPLEIKPGEVVEFAILRVRRRPVPEPSAAVLLTTPARVFGAPARQA